MVWEKRYSPPGASPGSLQEHPNVSKDVRITAIHYTTEHYKEERVTDLDTYLKTAPREGILWLNIDGLGNVSIVEKLGHHYGLHPLCLEDVLNVPQRPKLEDYEGYEFLVFRMALLQDMQTPTGKTEQVSLFLGPSYVLTFQEQPGDVFEPVRQRLRQARGKIRHSGADYLAYALLDAAIDGFFPVLEELSERLGNLEEAVLSNPTTEALEGIYTMRRAITNLRRAVWPAREAVNAFARSDSALITDQTRLFLRDCYDHILQVIDVLESYRDLGSGLMDTYLSSQGHRMNEVMKVLTVIATIFIPLTFVAGIYGMNFDIQKSPWNMPELSWYWGYPFSLFIMVVIAVALIAFFRRRGWL